MIKNYKRIIGFLAAIAILIGTILPIMTFAEDPTSSDGQLGLSPESSQQEGYQSPFSEPPPQGDDSTDGQIKIVAFLVNASGQAILPDGTLRQDGEKTVINSYLNTDAGGVWVFPTDGTPIDIFQIDVYQNPTNSLFYQYVPGVAGSDSSEEPVSLTDTEPTKTLFFGYTAQRDLAVMVKHPGDSIYTQSATQVVSAAMAGDTLDLASLNSNPTSPTNPLALPEGINLVGWAVAEGGAIVYQPDAIITMADDNLTLYAVTTDLPTAKIEVRPFLVNFAGYAVDWNGNILDQTNPTLWQYLDEYTYNVEVGGSINLPINANYSNFGKAKLSAATDRNITGYQGFVRQDQSLAKQYTFTVSLGNADMQVRVPYYLHYSATFHTNYPAATLTDTTFAIYTANDSLLSLSKPDNVSGYAAETILKTQNGYPTEYKLVGWAANATSTAINDPASPQYDPTFYPAQYGAIVQPAKDIDFYAIWVKTEDVKTVKAKATPYLVNLAGQPIDLAGTVSDFNPDTITKLYNLYFEVATSVNGGTTDFIVGTYYQIQAPASYYGEKITSSTYRQYKYNNQSALPQNGGSPTQILVRADDEGNLYDINNNPVTVYWGYTSEYLLNYHANYPADVTPPTLAKISYPTTPGTYQTSTQARTLFAPPAGKIFREWNTMADGSGESYIPYYYINGFGNVPIEPTAFTMPEHDVNLYAIYNNASDVVDVSVDFVVAKKYSPYSPIDKNGNDISNSLDFNSKKVVLSPSKLNFKLPVGSTYTILKPTKTSLANSFVINAITYSPTEGIYNNNGGSIVGGKISTSLSDVGNPLKINFGFYRPINITANPNYPDGAVSTPKVYSSTSGDSVNISNSIFTITAPTGYQLLGWAKTPNDPLNLVLQPGVTTLFKTPADDLILYAQWLKTSTTQPIGKIVIKSYLVDKNGNPLNAAGQIVSDVKDAEVISTADYHNNGSAELKLGFNYYPGAKNFTSSDTRYLYDANSVLHNGTASGSLVAITTANPIAVVYFGYTRNISYYINYNPNIPADLAAFAPLVGQPLYTNNKFAAAEVVKDELADYNNATLPDGFAYQFIGWTLTPDGSGVVYGKTQSELVMPQSNVELFAKWVKGYSVTFKPGGFGAIHNAESSGDYVVGNVAEGSSLPTAPTVLVQNGWVHTGWDNNFATTSTVNANLVFTATYQESPAGWSNITFVSGDLQKGTLEGTATFHALQGSPFDTTLVPKANPLNGYLFAGWDIPIPSIFPQDNVVITALWGDVPVDSLKVTFNRGENGNLISEDSQGNVVMLALKGGSIQSLPTPIALTGYEFAGWDKAITTQTIFEEDTFVTALWKKIDPSVPGGGGSGSGGGDSGDSGSSWSGWTDSPNGTPSGSTGNQTNNSGQSNISPTLPILNSVRGITSTNPSANNLPGIVIAPTPEIAQPAPPPTVQIFDKEVPLQGFEGEIGVFALVNLIVTILIWVVTAVVFLHTLKRNKKNKQDDDSADDKEEKKTSFAVITSLLLAIIALVTFILTEDIRLKMVLVDRFTVFMIIIALLQVVAITGAKIYKNNKDKKNQNKKVLAMTAN